LTVTVLRSSFPDSTGPSDIGIEESSMSRMLRIGTAGAALLASAVLLQGAVASAHDGGHDDPDRIRLSFHVETSPFNYTDLGKPGPSAADVIVFHDTLLRRGREVGHQVGSCTVVEPSGLSNCTGVITIDGRGTLAFAFENAPPPEKHFALTGGTGAYRTAHGEGVFVESGRDTGRLTLRVILD